MFEENLFPDFEIFTPALHVHAASDPSILRDIHQPHVTAAQWQRPDTAQDIARRIHAAVEANSLETLARKNTVLHLPVTSFGHTLKRDLLHTYFQNQAPALAFLADDIVTVFGHYKKTLTGRHKISAELRLQSSWSRSEAFHYDARKLTLAEKDFRLICCYYGTATEWLDAKGMITARGIARARSDNFIHAFGQGDVALMEKGYTGLHHRVPTTENTKIRVLLVMDAG